jgi:hypothetical protein
MKIMGCSLVCNDHWRIWEIGTGAVVVQMGIGNLSLYHILLGSLFYPEDGGSRFTKILVTIYQITWYHISEGCNYNLPSNWI